MLTGIRQETSIQGYLIGVGSPEDPRIIVHDGSTILSISLAPYPVVREMAEHLGLRVRLSGPGSWRRTAEGAWQLEWMNVRRVDVLKRHGLSAAIALLRDAKVQWPEDTLDRFAEYRSETA